MYLVFDDGIERLLIIGSAYTWLKALSCTPAMNTVSVSVSVCTVNVSVFIGACKTAWGNVVFVRPMGTRKQIR